MRSVWVPNEGRTLVAEMRRSTGVSAGTGKGWEISYSGSAVRATVIDVPGPDLVVSAAPTAGAFNVGYPGGWTVEVANVGGSASVGTVTVDLTLGTGQSLTSAAGTGWTCTGTAAVSCSHAGGLASGATLPPIDVLVGVDGAAPPSTTLSATALSLYL